MNYFQKSICIIVVCLGVGFLLPGLAWAHDGTEPHSDPLEDVSYQQNLDALLPPDLPFTDESGKPVQLGQFFSEKPVLLALAYYECPQLCSVVLSDLAAKLSQVSFDAGDEFEVVVVSIDSGETPEIASRAKTKVLESYGRPDKAAGWHFLTGEHEDIDRLAETVGFEYVYVPERDEYAHPAGVLVLTPGGRVSRYLFGLEYPASDLRLGLVDASNGKVGSPVDRFVLSCYAYDPVTGRYNLIVHRALQIGGVSAVLVLGGLVMVLIWQDRRKKPPTLQSQL